MKAAILVDSTASLHPELKSLDNIFEVELNLHWADGGSQKDTVDEKAMKKFYQRIEEEKKLPTTSQPEPGQIVQAFKAISQAGFDTVFVIALSSKISGTFNTMRLVGQEVAGELELHFCDSKGTSYIIEAIVKQALKLIELDLPPKEIASKLQWVADHSVIYLMVDDLRYLQKSGRLNASSALFGSMLRIKPLLYFDEEGKVVVYEKVRTAKKVYKKMEELAHQAIQTYPAGVDFAYAHGDAWEEMSDFYEHMQETFPHSHHRAGYLTPILGVHGGKGTQGLGIIARLPEMND